MVFPHAGLPTLRVETRYASSDQPDPSPGQYSLALSGIETNDRVTVEEYFCCGPVWLASPECGVGCLGGVSEESS